MCANPYVSDPVCVCVWWRQGKRDADGWFGPCVLQPGRHQVEFAAECSALQPGSILEIYSPPTAEPQRGLSASTDLARRSGPSQKHTAFLPHSQFNTPLYLWFS